MAATLLSRAPMMVTNPPENDDPHNATRSGSTPSICLRLDYDCQWWMVLLRPSYHISAADHGSAPIGTMVESHMDPSGNGNYNLHGCKPMPWRRSEALDAVLYSHYKRESSSVLILPCESDGCCPVFQLAFDHNDWAGFSIAVSKQAIVE